MKKSLFTVRKRKHSKHPQVIVDADRTRFSSMSLTHSHGDRKHRNIRLKDNPNVNDKKNAYISRRIIRDFKFNFSKAFKNYKLSNDDINNLIKFLQSKKKK